MIKTIYLAGGCFWGMEHLIKGIKGVISTTVGYANGDKESNANYKTVCSGNTGFQETVKVTYDPSVVSLDFILFAYFSVVHVEQRNQQGNDIGTQYQAGVYYTNDEDLETINRIFDIEKNNEEFYVKCGKLVNFYDAEEYHQDYLDKNPNGYCHISFVDMNKIKNIKDTHINYTKPAKELIKEL